MSKIKIPIQRLEAEFAAASANRDERTVPMTFYTGARVLQFSWEHGVYNLTLSMDPKHIRLKELNSGRAPFTLGHASSNDPLATIGVISNAHIDGSKAKADVRFSKRPDVEPIFADVMDGILPNVSVGARLHKMKETTKEGDAMKSFLATDWEPFAVALVGVGADPNAHFAAAEEQAVECEVEFSEVRATSPKEQAMPESITNAGEEARKIDEATLAAQTAERNRVLEITKIANLGKLDAKLAAEHVEKGTSVEDFRKVAFEQLATRSAENPTQGHRIEMGRDEVETRRMAFNEALRHRAGLINLTNQNPGYDYRGLASQGLVALASECVRASGKNPSRMSPYDIATLAMSTTDFPLILAGTADASLRAGYALAPNNWRQLFARRSAPNFKNQTELFVGMNNAPFSQVPESGEFKHGSLTEGSIAWKLLTYGQIISFTRQLIINDNLGALTNIPSQMGLKAAMRQAALAWATFVAANTATYPGDAGATALFAAGHSNLTNPGTAISTDALGVALMTIRAQKDLGGDLMAFGDSFFLVVPTGKEQIARQYTSEKYMPTAQSSVNPWTGTFTPIASAELQANSATAWYILPNPIGIAEVFIVGYLDGNEGVYSETRQGFDIDGTEWKARMDVGFGAVDYRGAYKNNGA